MIVSKEIILSIAFCLSIIPATHAQKPQKILGIAKENKTMEYYTVQSSLWQGEIKKNAQDGEAWINYYRAERAKLQLNRPELWPAEKETFYKILSPIISRAVNNIPDTFEYYYLKGMNSNEEEAKPAFLKAYEIDPDREEVYGWLLVHYIYNFEEVSLSVLSERMLNANIYSNASMMWNYNALESLDKNGIILTNGDMDSMQKWVLQFGLGIRKDVLVANRWMLVFDEGYRKKVFSMANVALPRKSRSDFENTTEYVDYLTAEILIKTDRPAYMSTGTGLEFFRQQQLEDKMYIVGNAIKYSEQNFNNTQVIRENFENKLFMEYLLKDFQVHSQNDVVKKNMNWTYLPALFHLRNHYDKLNLKDKSEWCSVLIDKIATDSGRKEEVLSWFN